jgi:hypothetical protein
LKVNEIAKMDSMLSEKVVHFKVMLQLVGRIMTVKATNFTGNMLTSGKNSFLSGRE